MQLRKVCSHPYLFDWPLDPDTHEPIVNDQLVNASGIMMVLERLLVELFRRGHKVLLFSQFTTMLDIVEVCIPVKCYTGAYRIAGMGRKLQRVEYMSDRWFYISHRETGTDEPFSSFLVGYIASETFVSFIVLAVNTSRWFRYQLDGSRHRHFL